MSAEYCLCIKRVFEQEHSCENVFHLQVHFNTNQTHFLMKVLHEDWF